MSIAMLQELTCIEERLDEAEARGKARGEAKATRETTLWLLKERFGTLPDSLVAQVQDADLVAVPESPFSCENFRTGRSSETKR